MPARGLALLAGFAAILAGCVLSEVPLDGKSCPCATGFVCDEVTNICLRAVEPTDGAVEPDSGAPPADAGPDAGGDAGPMPPAELGEACARDDACASGFCQLMSPGNGFCSRPCGRTADCPTLFSCLSTGDGFRVCVPGESFQKASGETCQDPDNVCQSGICDAMTCTERCARTGHCTAFGTGCILRPDFSQVCAPGPGTVAAGAACSVNADCASGICNRYRNQCADACCTDGDCPADQNCLIYDLDARTPVTICQPGGAGTTALGMPCTDAAECESGTCTPESPFDLTGPRICSVRCCSDADCGAFTGGLCRPIPGQLPGTQATTCFPP